MRLVVSHNCWSGSYTAFSEFRSAIAKTIGINLSSMLGFGSGTIKWESIPYDPLHILLNHPDSYGYIDLDDCEPLGKCLYEIADILTMLSVVDGIPDYRDSAIRFANGLFAAVKENTYVTFN